MPVTKVSFSPDKQTWHPSALPGQIVLVSTLGPDGSPNVAPKSWITMAAFAGPILAFGCNTEHTTYRNILATRAFVVNVPSEPLADRVWDLIRHRGARRLEASGFTLRPAAQVAAPIVEECRAHLECVFVSVTAFGDEVLVFGRMVAGSIDAACLEGGPAEQYFALRPIFFLEDGHYGSVETAKRVGVPQPAEQALYAVVVGRYDDADPETMNRHVAFLQSLRQAGSLWMAGPFTGEPAGDADPALGELAGIYVVRAPSLRDARAVAEQDPLVTAGAPFSVRAWTRTF